MKKPLKKATGTILIVITLLPYCMALDEQTESSSNIFNNILSWLKSAFGTDVNDNITFENNSSNCLPRTPVLNNSENNNTMPEMNNITPENITNETRNTPNNMPENFNESYVPEPRNMTGMPENNDTKYPPQIPENFDNNTPIEINSKNIQ
ncbi:hypothetical protein [Methanococcus sp. CF]